MYMSEIPPYFVAYARSAAGKQNREVEEVKIKLNLMSMFCNNYGVEARNQNIGKWDLVSRVHAWTLGVRP